MRRSRDRDNLILEDADGKPYGIYLAADFTAAHEKGIERLERMFGIDRSLPGIPGRTISRSVTHIAFREKSIRVETAESKKGRRRYQEHTVQFLIIDSYFNDDRSYHFDMLLDREFQERETDILGAFSEEEFALAAYSDRAKVAIEEIQFGLNNNDLAIMIRSEEHTSELQSLMRISYAVFCLKKTKHLI